MPGKEPVARSTGDPVAEQVGKLRQLFPEVMVEGKIDFDKLRLTLGDAIVEGMQERFSFTWTGKREAVQVLQTPSAATLIPCPEDSVNFETTQNLFIEGDNLEVLKLLFKPYFGKIKLFYIDPSYSADQIVFICPQITQISQIENTSYQSMNLICEIREICG